MNEIKELAPAFAAYKYGAGHLTDCVNWAVERLVKVEEEDDWDIILLAGSTEELEIKELVQTILHRYLDPEVQNADFWAGQLLIRLYDRYQSKSISIIKLEPIFWSMLNNLWPSGNWLVMLCRNCEYATGVDSFLKPFEDEFNYITDLWRESKSLDDFTKKYDRQISNSHEADFLKRNKR